jgi:SAM-dependent methyltransferase
MDAAAIRSHSAFGGRWYYKLELAPGLYTPGAYRGSIAAVRRLLRRVDVAGKQCLDVGMQEGMVPVLLKRRGAEAVGYDRILRNDRLELVQEALGLSFEVVGGMRLQELPAALGRTFDVVVFAGVLHHMFDPLGGLASVRGMVRNGGICIVEAPVIFGGGDAMHFNRAGKLTPQGLWFITPELLDYLLRFLRLKPLDIVYSSGKDRQGRVAIACRAVSEPLSDAGDEWMLNNPYRRDFAEYLDWAAIASDDPEVAYTSPESLVCRGGRLDVAASIDVTDPIPRDPEQERLTLAAEY